MLISESVAEEIWNAIKNSTGTMPHIHKDQIREISYRFLEPLLDLLIMSVEDLPSGHLIAEDVLRLLGSLIPLQSRYLESGFGEEVQPDLFLFESIDSILRRSLSEGSAVEPIESEIQSILKMVYPIAYKLLHEYRLNKNPNRPDIDDINMVRALFEQPFLPVYRKLSQRLSQGQASNQASKEPRSSEIEPVVIRAFSLKISALAITYLIGGASPIEKAKLLKTATALGFSDIVELLIKDKGADPNIEIDNLYPLHIACFRGDAAVIKILLENGAKINASSSKNGYTALHAACQYGKLSSVKCLLSHTAEADLMKVSIEGTTVLFLACQNGHNEVVQLLLRACVDITTTFKSATVLYVASQNGHVPVVRLLVSHKDVVKIINLPTETGETPLFMASQNGHGEVVRLLLEADADITTTFKGTSALFMACQRGHTATVRIFVGHKNVVKIINFPTETGEAPLYIASQEGHYEAAQLLLTAGADITKHSRERVTALCIASQQGHRSIIELFIAHKDTKKIINFPTENGATPLSLASEKGHDEIVKLLLEAGADIIGTSALYMASQNGHSPIVRILIEHKDVRKFINLKHKGESAALFVASQNGHSDIVRLLLGCDADITVLFGETSVLYAAAEAGNVAAVRCLTAHKDIQKIINLCSEDGSTALIMASQRGYHEVVRLLLDAGADIMAGISSEMESALYFASLEGHALVVRLFVAHDEIEKIINLRSSDGSTALFVASEKGHNEVVRLLLDVGADLTITNFEGCSALWMACQNNHVSVVRLFATQGSIKKIINLRERQGLTALIIASAKGHDEVVKSLLEAGADLAITDFKGCSALWMACQDNHVSVVRLLASHKDVKRIINLAVMENGLTALFVASQNGHDEVVQLLLNIGANLNITTFNGISALYMASQDNHVSIVKLLLESCADITITFKGVSVLHIASQNGCAPVVHLLLAHKDIKKIIDLKSANGITALIAAAVKDHNEVVQLLLASGADITITEHQGATAFYMACQSNHLSIVKLFLAHKDIQKIINHPLKSGFTPLMIAGDQKCFEIAQLLLEAGSDPDPRVSEYAKDTAVHFAYAPANRVPIMQHTEQEIKQLNKKGVEAFKAQNYQEAIPLFQQVLKYWGSVDKVVNPSAALSEASVLYNLGSAEMKWGHIPEAKDYLQRAIVISQSVGAEKETEKFTKRLAECEELVTDQGNRLKARV